MDPLSTTLLTTALKKPIEDLVSTATGKFKQFAKIWNVAGVTDSVRRSIDDLESVRTMFSGEPVLLSSFYYPSKIHVGGSGKAPTKVDNLDDLSGSANILVTGTLGQGKSMFMRYLCVEEAKRGARLPVFIELRGVDSKCNVACLLIKALQTIGFSDLDKVGLDFIFSSGRLVIFADGFDELKREFALGVQQEIAAAMAKHAKTQWIISSRPGSLSGHLETIPNLKQYRLAQLTEEDFVPFMQRLGVDDPLRAKLLNAVRSSSAEVKGVLTTPLMLTLLVETFGRSAAVPTNLHDFYVALFNVLAYRHDDQKLLFKRERATSLSNTELQDVFEAFSFLSKEVGVSLNDEQFSRIARNTARVVKKEFGPEGLKNDLTDSVCLMMRDGIKTAFIHKSIQEFFAAFFVKHNNDEGMAKKIYQTIRGSKLMIWSEELKFLEKIDEFRYQEYFRIPAIDELFSEIKYDPSKKIGVSKRSIREFFAKLNAKYLTLSGSGRSFGYFLFTGDSPVLSSAVLDLLATISPIGRAILLPNAEMPDYQSFPGGEMKTFAQFCRSNPSLEDGLVSRIRECLARLDRERTRQRKLVADHKTDLSRIILGEL
ncbi:NACHT domain protein [Burkholderia pseudomallei]|uniref:NACHT domain-containing protein n=1 Tax=Burkholderia pseudomallei TaxID=28450 RepID=UPI00050FE522|nr:NACHT domain-containing protein [Burkholderia pseudomallei]KGC25924.1 NACHT domain protein [Burkholderia pseudomallei]KGV60870.1 NACHT domain protein [Burkholderia pseudomallei ABCPW 91]KGX23117.1 NACHT domain protein [Burkholderia pseudomallei]KGX24827.1 NACHT domain protein [Burkholderia pseudomallei]